MPSSSRDTVHDIKTDPGPDADAADGDNGKDVNHQQHTISQIPSTFAGKLDLTEFANKSSNENNDNNNNSKEKSKGKAKGKDKDTDPLQKSPGLSHQVLPTATPAYSSPTTRAMKRRLMQNDVDAANKITTAAAAAAAAAASPITPHQTPSKSRRQSAKDSPSSLVGLSSFARPAATSATAEKTKATATITTPPVTPPISNFRDTIYPDMILLFVGVNPGIQTGLTGHSYAHPSNLYWKLLHQSGITTHRHPPRDTYALPELYNIGNTNLVVRPTRDASILTRSEMDEGARIALRKIADARPEAVCFVGKGVWEAVWRVNHGKPITKEEFRYGWQDEIENIGVADGWDGSRVFVATTTSGLAAGMTPAEKLEVWMELGKWVKARRRDRKPLGTAGSAPLVD